MRIPLKLLALTTVTALIAGCQLPRPEAAPTPSSSSAAGTATAGQPAPPPTRPGTGAPPGPAARPGPSKMGMVPSEKFWNPQFMEPELDDYVKMGVQWVRVELLWNQIERTRGQYDWSGAHRKVDAVQKRGMKVLLLLTYGNQWASGSADEKVPPTDPQTYAGYAAAAVREFSPKGVKFYEVWNEPNLADVFWRSPALRAGPDTVRTAATQYTAMLKASYTTMKKADPGITVLGAGLATTPNNGLRMHALDYTRAMYAAGAYDYFDAFAIHPYSAPHRPSRCTQEAETTWNGWCHMLSVHAFMEEQRRAHHPDHAPKMVWLTEFGADSSDTRISDAERGTILTEGYDLAYRADWMGPMFWYNYGDHDQGMKFGLVRSDNKTRKPYYDTYQNAARRHDGCTGTQQAKNRACGG